MAETKKFVYDDFKYDPYKASGSVNQALIDLNTHLQTKPTEQTFTWDEKLNTTIQEILDRKKFTYDLNGDALYQQYKDKYIQQGKLAMGDAIGQASAMTGGYGNSYAQSVGQQAYQAQLQNLNDIVPELYQLAYDKDRQEAQDLYNKYSMLGAERDWEHGKYREDLSDWYTDRDYLTNRHDSEREYDYNKYNDDRTFAYGKYADDKTYAYNDYLNEIADSKADTVKAEVINPQKYLTDMDKIVEWSEFIRTAESLDQVLLYVERLEQLDPSLADSLYDEWLEAHGLKPGKIDTEVGGIGTGYKPKGGGGNVSRYAAHYVN